MRALFCCFLISLVVFALTSTVQTEPTCQTASVTLRVTDPFGVPINPKETHIRLRPVWSVDRDYGTSFHNNYATGIPYDVYLLEVSANASSGQSRLVAIDREEVHITVGLFNRVVEGLENLNVLCGTVNPLDRKSVV